MNQPQDPFAGPDAPSANQRGEYSYREHGTPTPVRRVRSGRHVARVYEVQEVREFFSAGGGRVMLARAGSGKKTRFLVSVLDPPSSDECVFWAMHFSGALLEVGGRLGQLQIGWGVVEPAGWEGIG